MKKHQLNAEKRTTLGKKVKTLRKNGFVPANLFGKKIKSFAVQIPVAEFTKIFREVGETGVVEVMVGGKAHPVLITNVHIHPISRIALHADLHEVDLTQKVKASIPLVITGQAKAVVDKVGVLLTTLDKIEVEALPTELPEHIEVDVINLAAVNDAIKVGDLKVASNVTVLTDSELEVAKIGELIIEEKVEEVPVEAAVEGDQPKADKEGEAKEEGKTGEDQPKAEEKKEEKK